MRLRRLLGPTLLSMLGAISSQGALAQSEPGFDCTRASQNVERAICASSALGLLDRQMVELYHDKLQSLKENKDRDSFIHGNAAWMEHRNAYCDEGTHADLTCIRESYAQRMAALRRVSAAQTDDPFETTEDSVWLQIASEYVRQDAINRAYVYGQLIDHVADTKVFLSSNGWYAISLGPMSRDRARRVGSSLAYEIPDLEGDHFSNHGKGYLNLVYSARKRIYYPFQSPQPVVVKPPAAPVAKTPAPAAPPSTIVAKAPSPTPAPRTTTPARARTVPYIGGDGSRGATCQRASVRERQGLCYMLAVGEHACAEGLEKESGFNGGHIAGEAAIGAVCTAVASKVSSGVLTGDMLVTSALIGGVDAIGEGMMKNESRLVKFLGFALRTGVVAKKFQLANQCARMEARNCGYR